MLTEVLTHLCEQGDTLPKLVDSVREVVSPNLADGCVLLVPSVIPNRLELVQGNTTSGADASYAGLPECAQGLLELGKQGRLNDECARCVRYGSVEEGAFRTLTWNSIVFCPLVSPGRAAGAWLFWRNEGSSEFTDEEALTLGRFADLCAPLPLSMAYNAQMLFDRDIATHLDAAVVVTDHNLNVLRWNPAAEGLYGIPAESAIGRHLGTLYSTYYDDSGMDRDLAWSELQSTGRWQGQVTQQSKGNRTVSVHARVTAIRGEDGRSTGFVAVNRDNSELVQATSRLRVAEGRLAAALDAAGAMAVVLDDTGTIVAANKEWLDTALASGARMDQVSVGANYLAAVHRAADAGEQGAIRALASIEDVLSGRRQHASSEYQLDCQTDAAWYLCDVHRIGEPLGVVITHREISEARRLERALAHLETHDGLTGLGNRILLEQRIASAMQLPTVLRHGLGLIVSDVDGFTSVNEALGYKLGDEVLRLLAEQISELCPPSYTAYRLGGDQFAVFSSSTDQKSLIHTAETLRREIGSPFTIDGRGIQLTISVGVAALWPDSPDHDPLQDPSLLITRADAARIESKARGRNRVHDYTPALRAKSDSPLTLPREFLAGIEAGQVPMHYQQIRRLADDAVAGFEGLVRWERTASNVLAASYFAPLLSAPLVAGPLAQWGISQVVQDAQWLADQHPWLPLHLGINISAQQFLDIDVAAALESAISRAQLPASAIVVEVTETTTFTDDQRVLGQLQRIQDCGLSIALDDFGTGFSSLQHLRSLPVNAVKVDRSFTTGVGVDSTSEALVRALIGLAHDLGLWVVAEGVENTTQREWLAQAGCDYYQGYLAHRPAPLEESSRGLSDPRTSFPRTSPAARRSNADRASANSNSASIAGRRPVASHMSISRRSSAAVPIVDPITLS